MTIRLTTQQKAVYEYIREKIVERGYGPTVREIGGHMNIKSPNGVVCHLRALEKKGVIRRTANKSRAIELTESVGQMMGAHLPVIGTFAEGLCSIESTASKELDLTLLGGRENFSLQVLDETLVTVGMQRGDQLICRRDLQPGTTPLVVIRFSEREVRVARLSASDGNLRASIVGSGQTVRHIAPTQVIASVIGVVRMLEQIPPQAPPAEQTPDS